MASSTISERFRQFYFFIKRWIPIAKKSQKPGSRLVLLWNKARSWYLFITFFAIEPNMQKATFFCLKRVGIFLFRLQILSCQYCQLFSCFHFSERRRKQKMSTFFALRSDIIKSAKKVPFLHFGSLADWQMSTVGTILYLHWFDPPLDTFWLRVWMNIWISRQIAQVLQ